MRTIAALVLCSASLCFGQDTFEQVEKKISQFQLANGMTFIVYERHDAPVATLYTYADVGAAQQPTGKTGLAHMFEHMAFKGTDKIGTKDYAGEKDALAKVEVAYAAYVRERDKGIGRDDND